MKNRIYLAKSGKTWDDGLPIGNGRLGAMITGKVNEETIFVNEETLWYGPMRDRSNPDGRGQIDEIRRLLLAGEVEEAAFLAKMSMTSTPKYNNPYQPAGDLRLCFMNHQNVATEYSRILDIDQALATVSYTIDGVHYKREHFISVKYNVLVIRFTSDHSEGITLSANMSRKPFEEHTGKLSDLVVGNWGENGAGGVRYLTGVTMTATPLDGQTTNPVSVMGDFVYAKHAKEVVLYLTVGTDFEQRWNTLMEDAEYKNGKCDSKRESTKNEIRKHDSKEESIANEIGTCEVDIEINEQTLDKYSNDCPSCLCTKIMDTLETASQAGFESIKEEHLKTFTQLYDRFSLQINQAECPDITTDSMMDDIRSGNKNHMDYTTVLLFNYARYLMISSSYQCTMPSNLQGIWNGSYEPPWMSQYTININTEMNYWFVEKVGLSDCHLPLFEQLKRMIPNGRRTADKLYSCKGFCAHHNTNLWACTDIEGIFDASPYWPSGAAWLSLHLYEHYLFTMDKEFLQNTALPIMREAIRFFEDYLYEDTDGKLLTGPSLSPENTYRSVSGQKGALCMAPTMDSTILRQLIMWYLEGVEVINSTGIVKDFETVEKTKVSSKVNSSHEVYPSHEVSSSNEVESSHEVGSASELETFKSILDRLPPLKISSDGRILEWSREYVETEPGHRHISHMFGLHPGNEITQERPELYEAADKTIAYRLANGGGHTGWSKAWLCCFMSRLKNGNALYENLFQMMQKCIQNNLLDVHPPFQIDGNFGLAEAVIEGIVQSHAGYIELLPALPDAWQSGSVKGVILRGAIHADIIWENHSLKSCSLNAQEAIKIIVLYRGNKKEISLEKLIPKEVYFN